MEYFLGNCNVSSMTLIFVFFVSVTYNGNNKSNLVRYNIPELGCRLEEYKDA
jgi:hypothetical protein